MRAVHRVRGRTLSGDCCDRRCVGTPATVRGARRLLGDSEVGSGRGGGDSRTIHFCSINSRRVWNSGCRCVSGLVLLTLNYFGKHVVPATERPGRRARGRKLAPRKGGHTQGKPKTCGVLPLNSSGLVRLFAAAKNGSECSRQYFHVPGRSFPKPLLLMWARVRGVGRVPAATSSILRQRRRWRDAVLTPVSHQLFRFRMS